MIEPLLIIYSHNTFIDILKITTYYLNNYKNKILLIDKDFLEDIEYNKYYKKILKYNNNVPYASRLQEINNINEDYFIIMHEVDILIKYDINILNKFKNLMIENNYDKIEFQHCAEPHHINKRQFELNNPEINFENICKLYKTNNVNMIKYGYALFNVNPTMWKKKSFLEIMYKFGHLGYKTIEPNLELTDFISKMNCYSLLCNSPINCGHFSCDYFFLPLHILCHGEIFNPEPMYRDYKILINNDVLKEYNYICETFLKNSKRRKRNLFP